MSNQNTKVLYLVIGKGLNFSSDWDLKIYGIYEDEETAKSVAYHSNNPQRYNPFLDGNLTKTDSWKNKKQGFLKYIQPRVVAIELGKFDETIELKLDNHAIKDVRRLRECQTRL